MNDALTAARSTRVRLLEVTPELILDLLKVPESGLSMGTKTIYAIGDAIPQEAKALRCALNARGNIVVILEHASFDEIVEGNEIPTMRPAYRETGP